MTRLLAFSLAVVLSLTNGPLANANDLPADAEDDSFEVEPPLLIPNRDAEDALKAAAATPLVVDVAKIERDLERAKKATVGAERLFRIGVLAKVDVEKRALRVVRLQCDLQNARLAQARENAIQQERKFAANEIPKAQLMEAELVYEQATQSATEAAATRERAELAAAEVNLQRQQKLFTLGSTRRSEVARAAEKLAELKTPKNN